ncbi:PREDICTED: uncharacterized protein LOC109149624 [Ipomoea nil]|uniref:uncharacterized protein LOC109149624 n=1 Tax=Ipomoea nil TaxID=35883 RepID=UPI0009015FA9|nr:PREDICTED: uncharacterized protein LOC109149624 [Ipomoea nil]
MSQKFLKLVVTNGHSRCIPMVMVIVRDTFLCIKDTMESKPVSSFETIMWHLELIPRGEFDNTANGYLVEDKCVFGVEVFVLDSKFIEQQLSRSLEVGETFIWKVSDFSNLASKICFFRRIYCCILPMVSQFCVSSAMYTFKLYFT